MKTLTLYHDTESYAAVEEALSIVKEFFPDLEYEDISEEGSETMDYSIGRKTVTTTSETLEKLYTERRLIKRLLSLDPERYSDLRIREFEIKHIINQNYSPMSNTDFIFYDLKLAKQISDSATEMMAAQLGNTEKENNNSL